MSEDKWQTVVRVVWWLTSATPLFFFLRMGIPRIHPGMHFIIWTMATSLVSLIFYVFASLLLRKHARKVTFVEWLVLTALAYGVPKMTFLIVEAL